MSSYFKIGLSSWIIQDGNYSNFKTGQHASFAIEFSALSALSPIVGQDPPAALVQNVDASCYKIVGEVVHIREAEWWAIDAGILIYNSQKAPLEIDEGCWITGEVYLGVDPFFYFERLSRHHTAPGLIYDWKIVKIELQTAPFIKMSNGRQEWLERDPEQIGWREISETRAGFDDERGAEYVLYCELLGNPPRR